jgi:hypothetical protein
LGYRNWAEQTWREARCEVRATPAARSLVGVDGVDEVVAHGEQESL